MSIDAQQLSADLNKLSDVEVLMADAEKEVEIFHFQKTQDIFAKRREITRNIPLFWYIVLAQCEDFAEYVRPEDLKFMEEISDIYVHRTIADVGSDSKNGKDHRNFSITVEFGSGNAANPEADDSSVPAQKVTKNFEYVKDDGKDTLVSEAVAFEWPESLAGICPAQIRKEKNGEFTSEQRKNYRQGMRSFFAWFEWTGKKPGKEFRGGEDLTQLIVDEVFPSAVNLYVEAMNSEEDSDVDSSEGEELDVSEEDDEEEEPVSKKQKV